MSLRSFIERGALIAIGVLVWRCWYLQGVLAPNRVDSGSMAPSLLGTHRQVTCTDCRYVFPCGSEPGVAPVRAVCPNCGHAENAVDDLPDLAGDGLLLDRSVYSTRPPRRWEVVAFRHPEQADQICVKRVVGLPGEQIEIRHGDVYVNGQIQRKTLEQQRSMAISVHDASHQPTLEPVPPARWVALDASSQWGMHGGRVARARSTDQKAADWLVYRHWRRLPNQPGQVEFMPIDDTCGYNQTHPRRVEEVSPVGDLLLSFQLLRTWGDGMLSVCMTDGAAECEFRFWPAEGQYEVLLDGRAVPGGQGRLPTSLGRLQLEFSTIDQQFVVAADRQVVGTWERQSEKRKHSAAKEPFRIGVMRLGVVLDQLRVFRDVYYTKPSGIHARWGFRSPVRLEPNEFYVLGDNSPVSEDSRSWPGGPGVAAGLMVGKPLLVHWPMRQARLGQWQFQVPDPARIRYIP